MPTVYMKRMMKKGKVVLEMTPGRIIYRCQVCGQGYSPNIQPGGRIVKKAWMCPNGCTTEELSRSHHKIFLDQQIV